VGSVASWVFCRWRGDAGPGQDVGAEVAAPFDPVVVLLGQDGADEAVAKYLTPANFSPRRIEPTSLNEVLSSVSCFVLRGERQT